MSNWIDISCMFASGLTEAELKAFLPSTVFMENGFLCPSSGAFTNEELSNIFTGLFGLQAKQLEDAPINADFFQCLVDSNLCTWFTDKFAFVNARGTGTLTVTAPALGGPWEGILTYSGGGDNPPFTFGTSAASTLPILFYDQSENVTGGNNAVSLAGGQSVAIAQTAAAVGSVSGLLINTGCV